MEDINLGNKGSQELSLLDELPTPPYVKRIGNYLYFNLNELLLVFGC